MKMPDEWLGREAERRMVDGRSGSVAPVALWACMSSLTAGDTEPIARLVECRVDGSMTEWRALWLTKTVIAYGSVQKAKERWSAHSQGSSDSQPDVTIGWVRSLRSVARAEVTKASCRRAESFSGSGEEWMWSSIARVVFDDGASVEIPLFGESFSDETDMDAQTFLDELVQRL